jgi:hypothetical protein
MRIISNLPSQFQQEMEFLRPMFEERLAKMKDLGEGEWGDRPVRRSICSVHLPC